MYPADSSRTSFLVVHLDAPLFIKSVNVSYYPKADNVVRKHENFAGTSNTLQDVCSFIPIKAHCKLCLHIQRERSHGYSACAYVTRLQAVKRE